MTNPEEPRLDAVHLSLLASPTQETDGISTRRFDRILERIDEMPIDRISVGDHQGHHFECYSALGYIAGKTERVNLGPTIATAAARDVGIHAASLASLDAFSRGRAFAVLGRGDGMVKNLGLSPLTVAQAQASVSDIRTLLGEGRVESADRVIRMRWPGDVSKRVPIALAAGGPRMLEASGHIADEVYVSTGVAPDLIKQARSRVAAGATKSHRDPPPIWWVTPFGLADTIGEARSVVAESLSTIGNHSLRGTSYESKGVPESHWKSLEQFHREYDWDRKNASTGSTNGDLMRRLGLEQYFTERFAVVGTPTTVVGRLLELAARGVTRVMLKINNVSELDMLNDKVLPHVLPKRV